MRNDHLTYFTGCDLRSIGEAALNDVGRKTTLPPMTPWLFCNSRLLVFPKRGDYTPRTGIRSTGGNGAVVELCREMDSEPPDGGFLRPGLLVYRKSQLHVDTSFLWHLSSTREETGVVVVGVGGAGTAARRGRL